MKAEGVFLALHMPHTGYSCNMAGNTGLTSTPSDTSYMKATRREESYLLLPAYPAQQGEELTLHPPNDLPIQYKHCKTNKAGQYH